MPLYKILRLWVKSHPSYCHHIRDCRVQYMVLRLVSRLNQAHCYGLGLDSIDVYCSSVGNKTCRSDISECSFSMLFEWQRFTEIGSKLENLRCGCQLLFRVHNKQLLVLCRSTAEVWVVMNSISASATFHSHITCFLRSRDASDSVFITATISCL